MTDLTEQWKRGELPVGSYYASYLGEPRVWSYRDKQNQTYDLEYEIYEVLAKVPSYTEWKNFVDANTSLFDTVKMLEKDNFRLEKQNAELKETVEALESELKEVCDVLIRKCPEMKEWVMLNWKNLYEVQDE